MDAGLSIVIPSHSRADLLRACLASVLRHAPAGVEVLVVDDASPDGTVSAAASAFPGVTVLRLAGRGGFCRAANAGLARASRPVVELLNDDTEVGPGWAEAALARFADPSVGAVAPLVLRWPDGVVIDSAGDDYHLGGYARKRGHGRPPGPDDLRPRFVFGAAGAGAFYRREALDRVGLFPESFGAYFEDVDLSFRLHRAGYRVLFEPAARVLHHVGASYGGTPDAELLEQQSLNEERVFWRNVPGWALPVAVPVHALVLAAKAWRCWRRGGLGPFVRGRLRILGELAALHAHRRELARWPVPRSLARWGVECF